MDFEWDSAKASANLQMHGVAFEHAVKVFADPFAIERIDDRLDYGEERIVILGQCNGVLLHVTYTERPRALRIISARRAERHEQDYYFRENSG